MGEILNYFKEKYSKNNSETEDMFRKSTVKNSICSICDTYLTEVGVELEFEVLPRALPFAVSVLEEEPLKSKFVIEQVSKTIFNAKLREIEI